LEKKAFTYVALAMLVWAVSSTAIAGYYYTQYNIYQKEYRSIASDFNALSGTIGNLSDVMESISLRVNILVNYGNGTNVWHNNTALPVGSTAFTAILGVADVRYKDSGADLGILVTSVDGLTNNSTQGWFYWYRDVEKSEWVLPDYSCAKYILHRGDTIAFAYESYMTWPPPSPS
jgi:hypothetical protein